jgi:hypothetical protein
VHGLWSLDYEENFESLDESLWHIEAHNPQLAEKYVYSRNSYLYMLPYVDGENCTQWNCSESESVYLYIYHIRFVSLSLYLLVCARVQAMLRW